jgi:hypothetical protein
MRVLVVIALALGYKVGQIREARTYNRLLAEAWNAYDEQLWGKPSPAGIPQDPPRNPYE